MIFINDFWDIIVLVGLCAFGIYIFSFIVYYIFSGAFKINLYAKIFQSNKKYAIINLIVFSFILGGCLSYYWGTTNYGTVFCRNKFDSQFIISFTENHGDVYYQKADTEVEGNLVTIKEIYFYADVPLDNIYDDLPSLTGYDDQETVEDAKGNLWDIKLVSQLKDNKNQ